jgi:uncharacterized membrane protein
MGIINIGVGFMLLVAGRPAYAVFVGGMAYVLGVFLGKNLGFIPAGWNELIVPVGLTVLGVLLTYVARRWAARIAGIIAGIYMIYGLPTALGANNDWVSIPLAAILGIVFAVLLFFFFDIALVTISSLTAPLLILQSMRTSLDPVALYIILVIFGLIVQFLLTQYGKSSPD